MDFYGPFVLTHATIELMVTRNHPGVALLCDANGNVQVVVKSDNNVGEVLHQWVGRCERFFFCYTETGAHAERLQAQLTRLGKLCVANCGTASPVAQHWLQFH